MTEYSSKYIFSPNVSSSICWQMLGFNVKLELNWLYGVALQMGSNVELYYSYSLKDYLILV